MRKLYVLAFLFVLTLAACAQTPESEQPATPVPSPTHPVPSPSDAPSEAATATEIPPEPDVATESAGPVAIGATTTQESSPLPTPVPTASQPDPSLLPRFLREIDFGIPAGNSYGPRALSYHPGLKRLYALAHSQGVDAADMVAAIDSEKGEVLNVARTGPPSYAEGMLLVDPIRDRVYALSASEASCTILEAGSLSTITTLPSTELVALDADGGRLYAAGGMALRILDADSYELILESALSPGLQLTALEVDPVAERLYLAYRSSSGYGLGVFHAHTLDELESQPLPGRPVALLPDPERQRLYMTLGTSDDNLLWTLDSDGRLLDEQTLGEWTRKTVLTLDSQGGRLFLGRDAYRDHGITVVDLQTQKTVAEIPLSHAPSSLAWDGEHGWLLASHTYYNQISVLDIAAGQILSVIPTAIGLVDVDTDPGRGQVYVTDTSGSLHALDSDTDEELALLPGAGRIALDAKHGKLYTGGQGADRVRIFDLDSPKQVAEIPTKAIPVADAHGGGLYLVQRGIYLTGLDTLTITKAISDTLPQSPGFSPNPTAIDAVVDPGSGRLFATISNGVPGSNGGTYLYAYEPLTYERILTDTERSPWHLDVDPSTGWAYVSRTHMTSRATSLLVEGREYAARLESLFGALRVDPVLGRLFVSVRSEGRGRLFVLDSPTLDVLDSTPIPDGYELRALDPERHLLYLSREDGRLQIWSATGGEVPAADAPVPADLAAPGVHSLFLPPGGEALFALGDDHRLYRSKDGSHSWVRVGGGLPDEWVLDVGFSPDYDQDRTMFAALATADQGFGVWRSTDGGQSWRMSSAGLTDLAVFDVAVSAGFGRDRSVFALGRRGGLYRSTDASLTWQSLSGRYLPSTESVQYPSSLVLSPTYADDRTLMLEHNGLQRSTDGGDSWESAGVEMSGYGSGHVILPHDHAQSPRAYYVWIPGEEEQTSRALVWWDGDRGWEDIGYGPPVSGYGSGRAIVSADGVLTFLWTPRTAREDVQVFRSTDLLLARELETEPSWEKLVSDLSAAATNLELSEDGTSFYALDDWGRLHHWPAADLLWEDAMPVTPLAPSPTSTPEPPTCAAEPVRFREVWKLHRAALGCPREVAQEVLLGEQHFEKGNMIWESDGPAVYVLTAAGEWQVYDDTFVEGVDLEYDANLPPPPQQPVRGFGKVWREQLGGPSSELGWATEGERGIGGWRQRFDHGLLFWTGSDSDIEGTAYVLLDDGTWRMVPAAAP